MSDKAEEGELSHTEDMEKISREVASMLKTMGGDKEVLVEMTKLLNDVPGDLQQL